MNNRLYDIFVNDSNGSTIVVIPKENAGTAFDAQKVANRHFKSKTVELHVKAGVRRGNRVESLTDLNQKSNVWMVWR